MTTMTGPQARAYRLAKKAGIPVSFSDGKVVEFSTFNFGSRVTYPDGSVGEYDSSGAPASWMYRTENNAAR